MLRNSEIYRCELCGLESYGLKNYESHLKGKRHKRAISTGQIPNSPKKDSLYCSVCRVNCGTVEALKKHVQGKKHLKKLKKRRMDLSFRNYDEKFHKQIVEQEKRNQENYANYFVGSKFQANEIISEEGEQNTNVKTKAIHKHIVYDNSSMRARDAVQNVQRKPNQSGNQSKKKDREMAAAIRKIEGEKRREEMERSENERNLVLKGKKDDLDSSYDFAKEKFIFKQEKKLKDIKKEISFSINDSIEKINQSVDIVHNEIKNMFQ